SEPTNPLLALSNSLSGLAERVANSLVGVLSHGRLVACGFAWKADAAVTASDALEADEDISLLLADGRSVAATLAGRDPSTDGASTSVREATLQPLQAPAAKGVRFGDLVLALGRGREGASANLGMVSTVGGPWQSLRGGSIDSLVRLDMRLEPRREGALVIDGEGASLGMAGLRPRQRPRATPSRPPLRNVPRFMARRRRTTWD